MYKITYYRNGKKRVAIYATLGAAVNVAEEIFAKTGIIVGIEHA